MTPRHVAKAVIPAAGLGTRLLPATKSVAKELLPLGCKPVIHWLAEEAAAAGVREITVVISPEKQAVREYFTPDPGLRARLAGREHLLHHLDALLARVTFHFVHQHEPLGLGHAVLQARASTGNEPFFVLLGDAPILAARPVCAQLAACCDDAESVVLGLRRVPLEQTGRYGIVAGHELGPGLHRVDGLVEKPSPEAAPSRLAIAGRYLLTPAVYDSLQRQKPGTGGEIQLTDAIAAAVAETAVYGLVYDGHRFDVGNPTGYAEAQREYLAAAAGS